MLIVCDRTRSPRAERVRNRFLGEGIPCAFATPRELAACLPAVLIVTFTDILDDVRHMPCDHVFALAIGDGFVNTALNAARVPTEDEIVDAAWMELHKRLEMPQENRTPFGWFLSQDCFVARDFLELRGVTVPVTYAEKLIFLYLHFCAAVNTLVPAGKIARIYGNIPEDEDASGRVSALVSHLNRKLTEALGHPPIRFRRGAGYAMTLWPDIQEDKYGSETKSGRNARVL